MSKRKVDDEYIPPQEFKHETKKSKRSSGKKVSYAMLDKNAATIWRLDKQGVSGSNIADTLCIELGIPKHSLTGKQVNDWMHYRKKSGTGKPRQVSLKNNNLNANLGDDCM
jgi:hypothetical protein